MLVLRLPREVPLVQTIVKPMEPDVQPILTFNGTTANCYISVRAFGKPISVEMKLWHGSQMLAPWNDSGTIKATISESYGVSHKGYTIIVNWTINGVDFSQEQVSVICP